VAFNSYSYLIGLAAVVALFWALPARVRRAYVLVLSVAFYASWDWRYTVLPFAICLAAFLFARMIATRPEQGRRALTSGIAVVLAALAAFKYRVFLVDNAAAALAVFGRHPAIPAVALALPLGISFYSFEAISFLIDTRQRRVTTVSFTDLAIFVSFWPHLMAGPIVRVRELVPQLGFDRPFDERMLTRGLDRLILGLAQKNLLANNLAGFVDETFLPRAAALNTTVDNWFAAIAFGLQIYFDFAAYSNMAIGAAQLVGITLPENFNAPYHARTPPDFWARWHMTLSRWIRDYVFFPINARFRGAPGPLYASLLGTMALVGLWHGAGWGFVVWGVMHGVFLVLYRLWEAASQDRLARWRSSAVVVAAWRLFTLAAVTAAWIPFRAATLGQAATMMRTLAVPHGFRPTYPVNFYLVTILAACVAALEPFLAQVLSRIESRTPTVVHWFVLRPALYAVGLLLFLIFDDRDTQFIYFQF
jgi:alginate O-acetyltransferase complex protein AlgI